MRTAVGEDAVDAAKPGAAFIYRPIDVKTLRLVCCMGFHAMPQKVIHCAIQDRVQVIHAPTVGPFVVGFQAYVARPADRFFGPFRRFPMPVADERNRVFA